MNIRNLLLLLSAGVFLLCGPGTFRAARSQSETAFPTVSREGTLRRGGREFRALGVNYFDAFARHLKNPQDTSFEQGFRALKERGIPFARFMACGYWPSEWKLYQTDAEEYFRRLDRVVRAAEAAGIGLIPSLFWHFPTLSDLAGESADQWGNPRSKTIALMRRYTREIVTRYRDSPAIWGWEFGNEMNLPADLPNAAEHRPPVVPDLGTPSQRSARDEITHAMMRTALREFAREARRHDARRMLLSGNAFPRPSAWHQQQERAWTQDAPEQFAAMLRGDNPDPMNTLTVHLYSGDAGRFGKTITFQELLQQTMEASRKAKKALFVGEFGVPRQKDVGAERERFAEMLQAIVESGVPLAALWVYDYSGQDADWNVTAANGRAYQLQLLQNANRLLAR